jgi:hypothetical protein
MRKLTIVALLMCTIATLSSVYAQPAKSFGIGIIVGEPTGLSLKKWLNNDRAVDAGIAWSFSENDSLHLHADYLWHRFDLISSPEAPGRLPVYYGLGARIKLREDNRGRGRNDNDALVGIRIPIGISYIFAEAPFDLFAEIVPVLDVAPRSDFDLNAAIGMRYYF